MSGYPVLNQELLSGGDATSQNVVFQIPTALLGQFIEFTVYVYYSTGSTAGKMQIETAWANPNTGLTPASGAAAVWAAVGNTIDWAVADSWNHASVTGVFSLLRVRISTAVANGTVKVFIIAAGHAA